MSDNIKAWLGRVRDNIVHWARRCNGADDLGLAMVIACLALVVLDRFFKTGVLTLLGTALFLWALFRMLSHNKAGRMAENQRYRRWLSGLKVSSAQALVRLKNIRKYKYYRCPNCKALLRMPRGIGEKTVVCSQCRHTFRQKA